MIYIYGLFCPMAGMIRYIGKSVRPQDRLLAHVTVAKTGRGNHHTARWIRKLLRAGMLPELRILEVVEDWKCWKAAERRWIAEARAKGWPLTNTTDGGDAFPTLSGATRAAMTPKISAAIRNAWADPEQRKRYLAAFNAPAAKQRKSKAMLEAWKRPGMRKAVTTALSAIWSTPERKAFASERSKRMHGNPEQKARLLASVREAAKRPEVKARLAAAMKQVFARPEVRKQMAAKAKANWRKPEYRSKLWRPESRVKLAKSLATYWAENRPMMLKRMNDPARTAKISEAMTKRNADPSFRAIRDAPEARARQAAALKATWARRKAAQSMATS